MVPHVIIVGADKGGVGKTMISRTLLDYFGRRPDRNCRAIDTQVPGGILHRFVPDKCEIVDLARSDGQIRVFDTLKPDQVTIIDCQAGSLTPTLRTLSTIGFLDNVKRGRLKITVLHVLGSTHASLEEIKTVSGLVDGAKHVLVKNHINEGSYLGLSDELRAAANGGVINIQKLDELVADHVDRVGVLFDAFGKNDVNSRVMRGYVNSWMDKVFAEYDSIRLAD